MVITQAVILAGGEGKRLAHLTKDIPKPMININGIPFLVYLLKLLRRNHIKKVLFLLGYLQNIIIQYFGNGKAFGLEIEYSTGEVSYETGTRIRNASSLLEQDFLLLYCDNYWPLNLNNLLKFHCSKNVLATVTVYDNHNNFSKNNIQVNPYGYVVNYDKTRTKDGLNGVEIGFFILNKKVIDYMPSTNFSFENMIIPHLIREKQLAGFLTNEPYYSIGNPQRVLATDTYFRNKKFIFIDRDGVINKKPPKANYVTKWEDFIILPGVLQALHLLNNSNYHIILISNQAGISRGCMTQEDLEKIHQKFLLYLADHNLKIDDFYYCPHGWNDGCICRKPKPGMLIQAADDYSINLSETPFIGDDERDVIAGNSAGCPVFLVNEHCNLLDLVKKIV